jgi:O-antigen/teichoic acid export membrane protein
MFIGPLFVLPFSKSLFAVVGVLLIGRVIAWFAHFVLSLRVAEGLGDGVTVNKQLLGPLFRFGGWMTVTNVIGPLMVYLDRFMIGALLSIVSVAYYTTPFEIVTKLLVLPTALVAVLFPAFAAGFAYDQARTGVLFARAVKYVFVSLYPIVLLIVALSKEGLGLWLGAQFAQHSTHVMQLLAVGVLLNSLAQIPFALVQGAGRPDLTAKLHLIELPVYLVAVWWLIRVYGIEGAAAAWLVRVTIDTLVLFAIARRFLPLGARIGRSVPFIAVSLIFLLASALLPGGVFLKGSFVTLTLFGFLVMTWFRFLAPDERELIHASVNRFGRPVFGRG